MKKILSTLFVGTFVSLVACVHPVTPQPNPPMPSDTSECGLACQNLRAHNCEEGKPIHMIDGLTCGGGGQCVKGVCTVALEPDPCSETCEQFCHATQNNGIWLNPTCVKNITSCDQVNTTCAVGKLK